MWLVDRNTGRAFLLAKRMGIGWYLPEDPKNLLGALNAFFEEAARNCGVDDKWQDNLHQDNFCLAMESCDCDNPFVMTEWSYDHKMGEEPVRIKERTD
jgi:hypothetical protein